MKHLALLIVVRLALMPLIDMLQSCSGFFDRCQDASYYIPLVCDKVFCTAPGIMGMGIQTVLLSTHRTMAQWAETV